jgi:hypothetical protein
MSAASPLSLSPQLSSFLPAAPFCRVFGACVVLPPGGAAGVVFSQSYPRDLLEAATGDGGDLPEVIVPVESKPRARTDRRKAYNLFAHSTLYCMGSMVISGIHLPLSRLKAQL